MTPLDKPFANRGDPPLWRDGRSGRLDVGSPRPQPFRVARQPAPGPLRADATSTSSHGIAGDMLERPVRSSRAMRLWIRSLCLAVASASSLVACAVKDGAGASDSSTTDAGNDALTGTDASTGAESPVCESVAQSASPEPSGMRWCDSGQWTRENIATCVDHGTPPPIEESKCQPCDERNANGFCTSTDYMFAGCYYPCLIDDDCGAGFACVCATDYGVQGIVPYNTCVAAECRQSADCGSGQCMLTFDDCGGPVRLTCVTDDAECSSDLDCGEGYSCRAGADMPFACVEWDECV